MAADDRGGIAGEPVIAKVGSGRGAGVVPTIVTVRPVPWSVAISSRDPRVCHAARAGKAGLLPSLGSVGDPYDNAVAESFWGRMQTELLNRQRWDTRLQLASAIFEYIEGFHNRRRRHSALGWQTPLEFENTAHLRAPAPQITVQVTGS